MHFFQLVLIAVVAAVQFTGSVLPDFRKPEVFYVDAINGNDSNDGLTEKSALKTLSRANALNLKPGDKLLFRSGMIYEGQLKPKGSGTADQPIVIDRYGDGFKPKIQGNGIYTATLHLYNEEHYLITNLDVSNYGFQNKAGRYGVWVQLENYGTAHNITLSNLDVHDVNGSFIKNEGGGAGIVCSNNGFKKTRFDGLTIENCTVRQCHRNGILINGNWERSKWFPSLKVVIRKNLLEGVPGDGIVPIGCEGALIEYNVMRDCPRLLPEGEAAAGIWPWSCDNTIIQYNEVSDHKAPWDAQGFDSDWNCRNTLIQYNYSHDNEGGFLLICNDGAASRASSVGNTGSIVRYNLSVNDGLRAKGKHAGFSPVIHMAGPVKNTLIYNNVIYQYAKEIEIDSTIVDITSWSGVADSTVFANNIFYTKGTANFKVSNSNRTIFENNIYYGKHLDKPADSFALDANPGFVFTTPIGLPGLQNVVNFQLSKRSPAIGKGKIMVEAECKDFFGNTVTNTSKPSIGLHQAK